tara:strand:- start:637 stop:1431 length:795 start_codon:yes stop_codon:yes gene_type:complete
MLGNGLFHGMYNPAVVWLDDQGALFDGTNDFVQLTPQVDVSVQEEILRKGAIILRFKPFDAADDPYIFELGGTDGELSQPYMRLWYDTSESKLIFQRTVSDGEGGWGYGTGSNGYCYHTITGINFTRTNIDEAYWFVKCEWDQGEDRMVLTVNTGAEAVEGQSQCPDWGESHSFNRWYLGRAYSSNVRNMEGFIHNILVFNNIVGEADTDDIYNQGRAKDETHRIGTKPVMTWVGTENVWVASTQYANQLTATYNGAVWGTIHG